MFDVSKGTRFFVCGAMTQGLPHFQKIEPQVLRIQPAQIQAAAYRLKVGFPVLIEGGTDMVKGEFITLNGDNALELMDQLNGFLPENLEKSLAWRKVAIIQTESGFTDAWVYFINPKYLPKDATMIDRGDWRSSLFRDPALTDSLSDRQKQYIRKLGQIQGRESVDIDMELYRQLMKLEIIVDKGRRLALSKLGHEVYRFLV